MEISFINVSEKYKDVLDAWRPYSSFQEMFYLSQTCSHTCLFPFLIFYEQKPVGLIQIYSATEANRGHWHTNQLGNFGVDLFLRDDGLKAPIMLKTILDLFLKKIFKPHELQEVLINPNGDDVEHLSLFFGADFRVEETMMMKDGCSLLLEVFWI